MQLVANEAVTKAEELLPLGDAVLVRREAVEKTTRGGLALPETVQRTKTRQQPRGVVVAVGPGRYFENGQRNQMPVKVGDIVLVGDGAGMNHVRLEGQGDDLFIIDCDGILGVVREVS
jgi:chaperonin GroES